MQKKLYAIFAIIVAIVFSFSVCFAAEDVIKDATNTVKNTINNTENAVEGTMHNAGEAIHDSAEKTENTMENAGNKIEGIGNTLEKDAKNTTSSVTNTNNDGYDATRTATNGNATFMGMNSTAWTWLILGVAAIAIIAVVWYYSTRMNSENNHSKRD